MIECTELHIKTLKTSACPLTHILLAQNDNVPFLQSDNVPFLEKLGALHGEANERQRDLTGTINGATGGR
ncbi:MAG: hypothetical protein Q7R66_19970, partial [Undibacterium sp.]|uniref:hypothetical protein n=1 Tax=Undibacterium sp. TaxID=1914977 RepID=UPI00271B6F5E